MDPKHHVTIYFCGFRTRLGRVHPDGSWRRRFEPTMHGLDRFWCSRLGTILAESQLFCQVGAGKSQNVVPRGFRMVEKPY